ncbi:MAG: PKD domain-containing protein [Bacteroidia bacterium]
MGLSDALHIKAASQNQQAALTGFNHPYFSGSVQYESESAQTIVPGTYNNLRISGSGTRTIHGRVNLKGVLQLEAGILETGDSLTLKSDSLTTGLISGSGNGSINGEVESERYIHGTGNQTVYLSNPFEGLHVIDYATAIPVPGPDGVTWSAGNNNAIWEYNPNDPVEQFMNGFHSLGANRELLIGKGYSATLQGGSVLSTKGNAASGTVNIALGSNGNISQFSGYNLVGNPYLSPLDWNKAAFSQTDNISKAVYRMGSGNRYNGSLSVWMAISEDEGLGINGASSNIGIQEGFFVKAFTADTLRLNNSHRSDETNVHAVQVNDFRAYLRLSLIKDQKRDETLIWFDADNNSQQLLDGQDALKPAVPGAMTISSVKEERMLAIQGRQTALDEDSVALALHVPADGSYTIRLTDVIHFPATAMMYLEDRLTGTFQNLRTEPSYTVVLNEGDINGRFFLHYRAGVETNAIAEGCEGNDGQITLHNSASTQWDIKLFNSNDSLVAERYQFTGNWSVQALRADEYRLEFTLSGQSLLIDEYLTVETGNAISASLTASVTEVKMEEEEVILTNTSIGSEYVFWEFGDGMMVSDENEVSHIYSDPGHYDVVMRVTRGECSDTAMVTIHVITITGIEDAKAPESFTLFPNPASTIAYIRPEIDEPLENGTYVIVDASGRVIFQKQVSYLSPGQTLELPVSDLPPGTYQVVLSAGKFKGVSRLLVNR